MPIERLFVLHHTHVDLGYTELSPWVDETLINAVEETLDLVAQHASAPPELRFRWVHEVSWPVVQYLQRPQARREELFSHLREGLLELCALYAHPTELMDRAGFEQSLSYAQHLAQEGGFTVDTAMVTDVPGVSWSLAEVLAENGIRYLDASPNVMMAAPLQVERPFWWVGPQGRRVLTWLTDWRINWYSEGILLGMLGDPERSCQKLEQYLQRLQQEGYRWKGLCLHLAHDNQGPSERPLQAIELWNQRHPECLACLATNHEFFEFMESQHAEEFPVYSLAWPDWWSESLGSAAFETGLARKTTFSLYRNAPLAQQVSRALQEEYAGEREQIWDDLLLFAEHTWGHTSVATDPLGYRARAGWAYHSLYAYRAFHRMHRLEQRLTQAALLGAEPGVYLFNPLPSAYHGPVQISLPEGAEVEVAAVQGEAGRLPLQPPPPETGAPEKRYLMVDVAPGEKRYYAWAPTAPAEQSSLSSGPDFLANDFFRLEFDPRSGTIRQAIDLAEDRALVGSAPPWHFGEVIHERVAGGLSRRGICDLSYGNHSPESRRPTPEFERVGSADGSRLLRCQVGPVFGSLLTEATLPEARLVTELRLFAGLPRLDLIVKIFKQPETEYESLFLALPLDLSSPRFWISNAGAAFQAGEGQLPGSCRDFYVAGDYVAVTDQAHTIVVTPVEMPLVQVGELTTGRWNRHDPPSHADLYLWMTNNLWYTCYPLYQCGEVTLHWSLTAQAGDFDQQAAADFARRVQWGTASAVRIPEPKRE